MQFDIVQTPKGRKVFYGGQWYYNYPNGRTKQARDYWLHASAWAGGRIGSLHRHIYEDCIGPIPDGYHVHHIDHDHDNNDPANLVAMPFIEHVSYHGRVRSKESLKTQRAGLAKHWDEKPFLDCVCEQCNGGFKSRATVRPRFCSPKCSNDHHNGLRKKHGIVRPSPGVPD